MKFYTWVLGLTAICVFQLSVYAQTGWVALNNPLGMGEEAMIGKVQFVSEMEGWISCGDGRLLHTTDGGQYWDIIDPFPSDTVERFSDPAITMSWIGNSHGWIIGTIGGLNEPRGAVVYYSTNYGQQWQEKVLSTEPGTMGIQIQFVDQNNGWALLFNFSNGTPTSLKTTDGGNTWNPFNGQGIFYFADANNGWAYSGSGETGMEPPLKIYKTIDGGTNWELQFVDYSDGTYNAMMFTDLNNGWVVGTLGKVVKTTDGGANWTFVTNTGVNVLESCKTVFFLDENTGWIPTKAGDDNQTPILKHTTDGGNTWTTQTTPFGSQQGSNAIFSIHFIDAQHGWITGDWGRIARYNGVTGVKDEINSVDNFSLEQNYPNPFNPSTKIKFTVPSVALSMSSRAESRDEGTKVRLAVYDVLGNEVATLVNEYKPAGTYEIDFDAASLSSGIYFYSLKTGGFSETRKMIFLK